MIFGNKPVPQKPAQNKEGCQIKIKRDKHGRVSQISTNGSCTKEQIKMASQGMANQEPDEVSEEDF